MCLDVQKASPVTPPHHASIQAETSCFHPQPPTSHQTKSTHLIKIPTISASHHHTQSLGTCNKAAANKVSTPTISHGDKMPERKGSPRSLSQSCALAPNFASEWLSARAAGNCKERCGYHPTKRVNWLARQPVVVRCVSREFARKD